MPLIPETLALSDGITRLEAAQPVSWKIVGEADVETRTPQRLAFHAKAPVLIVAAAIGGADIDVCQVGKTKPGWKLPTLPKIPLPSWGAVKAAAPWVVMLVVLGMVAWGKIDWLKPDNPPNPPQPPAPIPVAGLRVLVVHESTDGAALLTPKQVDELWGEEFQTFARAKCAKGSDGKTPECLILDKDTPPGKSASEAMRQAFARPRAEVPWLIVSNGKTGFEGKLPNGGILDLVKRYAQ